MSDRLRLVRTAHTATMAATTVTTAAALMAGSPRMTRAAGLVAALNGAATLATPDRVNVSKAGAAALLAGGIGLMAAGTPTGRSRAALLAAAGTMMNIVSVQGNGEVQAHRNAIKGAILGGSLGVAAALGRGSFGTAVAVGAVGLAVGAAAGRLVDNSRAHVAPENVMPLVRHSPQLVHLLR